MNKIKISIIGLGYVGLPLARLFATKYAVVGFDVHKARVAELKAGHDATLEVEPAILNDVLVEENSHDKGLFITDSVEDLSDSNYYIVTVPTPVDKNNSPVLTPLIKASETVGQVLKNNDIVIYESTVYPGATEEDCIPVLERVSGLKFNTHFFAGYSQKEPPASRQPHWAQAAQIGWHSLCCWLSSSRPSRPSAANRLSVKKYGRHREPEVTNPLKRTER